MEQILYTFGIDWRLLLINATNFGLLLAGLTYFLYTPINRMLEERRAKVAQGVHEAEAASQRLQEIEASRSGLLAEAGKEADSIVSAARSAGVEKQRELQSQAEAAAASVLKDAEREAQELKDQALRESKQEVAKLIVLGMEKTFEKK
jgi:F-type H+-transporting ATPase subunit b